jgi:microsomal prostaglandin-E synthase 2
MILRRVVPAAAAAVASFTAAPYARRVISTTDSKPPPQLTLYQYKVCPFCNKTQAFLEYHHYPHTRVEVNPLSKKEISFSKDYRMVPLALVQNTQINGSDEIIDFAAKQLGLPAISEDELVWRNFVNNKLIKLLPPNIYRTPSEAIQAFDYITSSSNFSAWEKFTARYTGALAMYFIAKRALTKYEIKDPRGTLVDAMNKWAVEGVGANKLFHGGDKQPDRADLAVFGVIRSIEGNYVSHYTMFFFPTNNNTKATWEDMRRLVKPEFWAWYDRVKVLLL